jgi:hypothetical protein
MLLELLLFRRLSQVTKIVIDMLDSVLDGQPLAAGLNTMPHDKALKNLSHLAVSTLYMTAPDWRGIASLASVFLSAPPL